MNRLRAFTGAAALAGAVAFGAAAVPAVAQQSGLVNVSLSNVANNIAKNINVNASQIPVTVQAPIGVAANVCGVNANVLAQQGPSGATCTATTTSRAFDQIVQRQIQSPAQH